MSSAPATEDIARDATWLAQALDPNAGAVRLVAMARDSYRAASFLDDRLMQQPVDAQVVPWPDVEAAVMLGMPRTGMALRSMACSRSASRGCFETLHSSRPRSATAISRLSRA